VSRREEMQRWKADVGWSQVRHDGHGKEVMELKDWALRRDPKHHPVRFLAGIWEQRTATQLNDMEFGQLRDLREALGDFTRDLIEWILDPVHWWHFCQFVRAESGLHRAPDHPHLGFLLKHRGRALRIMRWELRKSNSEADIVKRLEHKQYEEIKTLVTAAYAVGRPEWLAKIEVAKTLTEIQQVFIEIVDENTAASKQVGA
jgi:hypothetical protein